MRQGLLVFADEIDGVLDLQLGPLRQRPVFQAEHAADRVERGVEADREVVGVIAEQRERRDEKCDAGRRASEIDHERSTSLPAKSREPPSLKHP